MRSQSTRRPTRRAGVRPGSLAVAVITTLAGAGLATASTPNRYDDYIGTGVGNWFDAANWDAGVPVSSDNARIIGSPTLNINGDAVGGLIAFGWDNQNPVINLGTGASLTSFGGITFGGSGANTGGTNVTTFNQTGGAVTVEGPGLPDTIIIGNGGNAVYNMSGGTMRISGPDWVNTGFLGLTVGGSIGGTPNASGTLNISGGTIYSDQLFQVARGGANGTVNMTGGTINAGLNVWLGSFGTTGGKATITQSGGTLNVGYNASGTDPSTFDNDGNLYLGYGSSATNRGTYTLSGTGAIRTQDAFSIGGGYGGGATAPTGGYGDFIMNGGTVDLGAQFAPQSVGGGFYIGDTVWTLPTDGTATINAGTFTMHVANAPIVVGSYQFNGSATLPTDSAVLTINGGQLLNSKGIMEIGRAGATGTVNLSGGQLTVGSLTWLNPSGNTNVRQFNFTGGTLDLNSANSDYVLTNAGGTFRPGGTAIKTFTTTGADGSYAQSSGSVSIDLASNADYDALDLSGGAVGAANLTGGSVNVTATGAYTPAFGAAFPVITAKSIGDSATWNLPSAGAGNTWDRRLSTDGNGNQVESLAVVRSSSSTLTSGSSWASATWSAGTPNGADASAKLAGSGGNISIDAPTTLGYLQLDGSGSWTVGGSSTLSFNASSGPAGIMAFGGSHTISAPVAFNSNSAIGTQLKSTNVTLSGNVSGSATVEKTGPGSLTLSSTSSPFTGTWSVSGGSLNIDSDANLGAAGAKLALNNATLNSTGAVNSARNIALGSSGATLNLGGDSTFSGVLSGNGGINNVGSTALTLSAANSYAGATQVTAGTIRQGVDNAIPAASAVTIAPGATLDLGGKVGSVLSLSGGGNVNGSGAGLTVGANGTASTSATFTGTISGGGTLTKAGPGTQVLTGPGGTATNLIATDGPINVTGGTLNVTGLNFGVYDLPSNDINVSAGATFGMSGTGTGGALYFNSIHGAGSLALLGGAVSLLSPSDFTGGTTFVVPTNLALADFGALGPAGTPIHFAAAGSSDRGYAGSILFGADGTFSHPITIDGYKYAAITAGVNLPQHVILDQPISGPGDTDFGGLSGSSITFAAVNTYTGTTQVEPGVTLVVGVDNALPHDGGIYLYGNLDLSGHNQTLNTLGGAGATATAPGATINLNGGNLTLSSDIDDIYGYAGVITGNGSVTKTGGGIQVFALPAISANNYTGPTTIHQGALQISGNVNGLPAGGPVQVDKGADLIFATSAAGSNLPAGSTVNFTGNISGDGEVQIASTSVDPITLSGTNTYTGGTRMSDGYLRVMDNSNLGAPTTPITYYWSGSNPGPVLQFGAADVNLTRDIIVQHSPAFVDTNGFNATVQNIDANMNGSTGGPADFRKLGGAGTLTADHVRVNTLTVSVGTLKIAPNAGLNSVSNVRGLTIAAGAFFDLNNNKMVIGGNKTGTWDSTNNVYKDITGMVASARNGGTWDGTTGITSSAAAADPTHKLYSIGVAAAGDIVNVSSGTATWNGQTVGAGDTLVMYTYGGDANLDGKINIDDYGLIDSHVGQSGTAFGWHNGDFNYDGKINIDDYGIIDGNIGAQGAPLSAQVLAMSDGVGTLGGVSAVPEPTSLALLGLASGALLRRKRRSAR